MERSKTRWQMFVESHPEVAHVHGIHRVALRQRVRHGIASRVGWVDADASATQESLLLAGPLYPIAAVAS